MTWKGVFRGNKALNGDHRIPRTRLTLASIIGNAAYRCLFMTICFLVLVQLDFITLPMALFAAGFVFVLDVITFTIFVREMVKVVNFIRKLAAHPHEDQEPPVVYELINKDAVDAALKLHSRWRRREIEQRDFLFSRERVFDAILDPMLLIRPPSLVVGANAAAHRLFQRDVIGLDVTSFLRAPEVLDVIHSLTEDSSATSVSWTDQQGRVDRFFDVSIIPLPAGEKTSAINIMLTLHDITEIKHLEKMRANFVANASHELRTPLASVIGFAETIQTSAKTDPKAQERFISIILEQSRRMKRVVDDLLSLSNIEMNARFAPEEEVDVVALLNHVIAAMGLIAKKREMDLVCDIADDLPFAMGDPDQITQVFQNLIDNALKYGTSGTSVLISIRAVKKGPLSMPAPLRRNALRIEISNDGDPIDQEDLMRLTERFYRVDRARSRSIGGTGLGLAIVKHIIIRHRGALSLNDKPQGGLSVMFYLPSFSQTGNKKDEDKTTPFESLA